MADSGRRKGKIDAKMEKVIACLLIARTIADAAEMAPIRIKAGALGVNTPKRDLVVSPDHCLYLDGALVPARLLVNGRSVVAETGMAEVTWYHVELETHEVLVADGAAADVGSGAATVVVQVVGG
jgi:hypothetical protein